MDVSRVIGTGAPDRAVEDEAPASLVINPHSELGKELRRWEQHRTELVPRGSNPGNPYVFRPYPKMLYKAQRTPGGQIRCMDAAPHPFDFERPDQFERAMLMKDQFDKSCQRIVGDEAAEAIAKGQGWAESPAAALAAAEARDVAISTAAAEAAFHAQRMSAGARAELVAADAQTHEHVVDVQPKVKRGRKAKGTHAVTGSGPVEE